MVETAAHLADHVIPRLPVRQWVVSVPKRLRYHLERDPAVLNTTLHIFLTAIERVLRQHSPGASAASRLGAVIFIHRFGALLNTHLHFHCIVVDGVFEADAGRTAKCGKRPDDEGKADVSKGSSVRVRQNGKLPFGDIAWCPAGNRGIVDGAGADRHRPVRPNSRTMPELLPFCDSPPVRLVSRDGLQGLQT